MLAGMALHRVFLDRSEVPDLHAFLQFSPPAPPTTGHVYDANGSVLIELAREYRRVVRYRDLPPVLRDALLSAEDRDFFSHRGVDFRVLPRVLQRTLAHHLARRSDGSSRTRSSHALFPQGGSTITQQIVRAFFLRDLTAREGSDALLFDGVVARTAAALFGAPTVNKLGRKLDEMRLALWLEEELARRFGSRTRAKEEILARYASFLYLGHGRYGFAAAADHYFRKRLSQIDAAEAALLAGIIKSPRAYAPAEGRLAMPSQRRNEVLSLMATNGFLAPQEAATLALTPIRLATPPAVKTDAPGAVHHVLHELASVGKDVDDLLEGKLQVHSTIDSRVQQVVHEGLAAGFAAYEGRHPHHRGSLEGAVVVLRNSDAAVLAEAGGRRGGRARRAAYTDFNGATQALRQPGSAMKPFVYLAAFRSGAFELDTPVVDAPIAVSMGRHRRAKQIANYDGRFEGAIPARQALAESRNAAAIWVAERVGTSSILETARDAGIETALKPYVTTALGASEVTLLELANAYRTLATGVRVRPHAIRELTGSAGRVLYQRDDAGLTLDGDERALEQIREALRGVVRLPHGTAHALDSADFGIPVMGKTGTTNDFRDALFVGSTYGPDGVTVAVRLGFDDNSPLGRGESGGRLALPIFREIVARIYREGLAGPVPEFPPAIERGIDAYLDLRRETPRPAVNLREFSDVTTAVDLDGPVRSDR